MPDTPALSQLAEAARAARTRAYPPYSKFCVGAAVLLDNGAGVVWVDGVGATPLSSLLPTPFKLRTDT